VRGCITHLSPTGNRAIICQKEWRLILEYYSILPLMNALQACLTVKELSYIKDLQTTSTVTSRCPFVDGKECNRPDLYTSFATSCKGPKPKEDQNAKWNTDEIDKEAEVSLLREPMYRIGLKGPEVSSGAQDFAQELMWTSSSHFYIQQVLENAVLEIIVFKSLLNGLCYMFKL
jgi:hypothetical protein